VILCVGETLEQRKANQTTEVLEQQIILGLSAVSANSLPRLSIAYEPIWAIGNTGHHATPQQAEKEHIVIRKRLAQMFGKTAQSIVILYGGSVKPENAAALLIQPNVDGALIGGASLKAEQFLAIVQVGIKQTQTDGKSM
jgi:triosephosphate isomerase